MSGDDIVKLIFVTPQNHMPIHGVTRKWASELIAGWYKMREEILNSGPDKEKALAWQKHATFAMNYPESDGNIYGSWAIGWEHVLGMYISPAENAQDRIAKAQEELVVLVRSNSAAQLEAERKFIEDQKKIREDLERGEEWRKGEQDEEET